MDRGAAVILTAFVGGLIALQAPINSMLGKSVGTFQAAFVSFAIGTIETAKEQGHVTTLFGRRRQIPELRARNYQVRTLGERLAVNTVIQGTAADVLKLAMIRAHDALEQSGLRARAILTVHDELLFEVPEDEVDAVRELVEREMVAPWEPRDPPLAVDIGVGKTWLDAK